MVYDLVRIEDKIPIIRIVKSSSRMEKPRDSDNIGAASKN
jgi:hypothetical protein